MLAVIAALTLTFSAPFIRRPVATILLSLALLLAGVVAFPFLPVAALPSVDIPVIVVFASRPGADPDTMASSVAAPLERHLGVIGGVEQMTSISATGASTIIVQFDVGRDIDGAAHDVQAAINAANADLPTGLPTSPFYRKFNPAEAPVLTLALTSPNLSLARLYDVADSILGQRLSQIEGVSQVQIVGAEKPAMRIRLDPVRLAAAGLAAQDVVNAVRFANVIGATGGFEGPAHAETLALNGQLDRAGEYAGLVVKAAGGAVLRVRDVGTVVAGVSNTRLAAWSGRQPAILLSISKAADANVIGTVARIKAILPQLRGARPGRNCRSSRTAPPRSAPISKASRRRC